MFDRPRRAFPNRSQIRRRWLDLITLHWLELEADRSSSPTKIGPWTAPDLIPVRRPSLPGPYRPPASARARATTAWPAGQPAHSTRISSKNHPPLFFSSSRALPVERGLGFATRERRRLTTFQGVRAQVRPQLARACNVPPRYKFMPLHTAHTQRTPTPHTQCTHNSTPGAHKSTQVWPSHTALSRRRIHRPVHVR